MRAGLGAAERGSALGEDRHAAAGTGLELPFPSCTCGLRVKAAVGQRALKALDRWIRSGTLRRGMVTIAMSSETQSRRAGVRPRSAYPLLRLREMGVDSRSRDSSKCSSDHRLSRHCRVDEWEDGSRR